uniref:Uncharacterized protein n=1 Tax=Oryzias latipes TaxID=8090 RepID=A0A3P9MLZ9_ORYLA
QRKHNRFNRKKKKVNLIFHTCGTPPPSCSEQEVPAAPKKPNSHRLLLRIKQLLSHSICQNNNSCSARHCISSVCILTQR